jgi:Cyclic-phosphate processing Receiver domain
MRILILEDNAERRTAMWEHAADRLPMFAVAFFESSNSMIHSLRETGTDDVALVSLDNDLEPLGYEEGRPIDAGDGLAVARFLIESANPSQPSADFPILIHSTNDIAATSMQESLSDAGWDVSRIVPYDGEKWIGEAWIRCVRQRLIASVHEQRTISHNQ